MKIHLITRAGKQFEGIYSECPEFQGLSLQTGTVEEAVELGKTLVEEVFTVTPEETAANLSSRFRRVAGLALGHLNPNMDVYAIGRIEL